MILRLQKFLADSGVASRRKSEELILSKRITVNGNIISEPGFKIDDKIDTVTFDGKKVTKNERYIYILFNKPEGCVSTVKDQFGRKTVLDYFKNIPERIYPVGRLDYNTSGLLIMTNDGKLAYILTHPKHNIEKVYIAKVDKTPNDRDILLFKEGIEIDGRKTWPAKLTILKKDKKGTFIKIVIHEGRNRQVRKMCAAIGCNVISLKRTAIGKIELTNLKKGEYRFLSKNEIEYLKNR